jgi:hypothetical protein
MTKAMVSVTISNPGAATSSTQAWTARWFGATDSHVQVPEARHGPARLGAALSSRPVGINGHAASAAGLRGAAWRTPAPTVRAGLPLLDGCRAR